MGTAVVIPVYNAESFIHETLDSVFRQTRPPEEIVVVDDHSSDGTVAALERLKGTSPVPLRVIALEANSRGPAHPLNVGLRSCRSEFISLLDHDDLMEPEKLEIQHRCIEALPEAELVFSDYLWFTGGEELVGMQPDEVEQVSRYGRESDGFRLLPADVTTLLQVRHPGLIQSCSNLFFRRRLFDVAGPFDESRTVISDYVFKLNATAHGPAAFVPRKLFQKRLHKRNLFGASWSPRLIQDVCRVGFDALGKNPEFLQRNPGLAQEIRQHFLDLAFELRRKKELSLSLWVHYQNLRRLGAKRSTMIDLVKWPVGAARDVLRARHPQHAS